MTVDEIVPWRPAPRLIHTCSSERLLPRVVPDPPLRFCDSSECVPGRSCQSSGAKKNGNGTGENRGERDELTSGDQRELPPARRDRETEVIAADCRGSAVEREISVSRRACEKEARAAGVTKRKSRSALMMWAWPGGSPRHMGVLSPHRT